jgi:WD40 repeat protein
MCPQGPGQKPLATLPAFGAAVNAVALAAAPAPAGSVSAGAAAALLLAVGQEDGCIEVWRLQQQQLRDAGGGATAERLWGSGAEQRHAAAVRRLAWQGSMQPDGALLLASCSDDHSVRVCACSV